MKKSLVVLFSIFFALAVGQFAFAQDRVLSPGEKGDEVKALQEILKEDKMGSFQGKSTGFFGPVTKKALEKLQVRCGVSQTGELDQDTEKCIFPNEYQITVLSPNGGETWDRGQTQTIKWNAVAIAPETTSTNQGKAMTPPMPPIWAKASIDLFRNGPAILMPCKVLPDGKEICPPRGSTFVRHINTVNIFAGSYSWNIPSSVANGSDYLIRITVGRAIWPMYLQDRGEKNSFSPSDVWPSPLLAWDESDNPFSVTGSSQPPSDDLRKILEMLNKISEDLARVTQLLKEVIASR